MAPPIEHHLKQNKKQVRHHADPQLAAVLQFFKRVHQNIHTIAVFATLEVNNFTKPNTIRVAMGAGRQVLLSCE